MREQRLKRLKTDNDSTLHTPQAEQLPLWQALFENAMDAVLLVDDDACCLDGNPAASELLGRPRAEISSLAMWDILSAEGGCSREMWRTIFVKGEREGVCRLDPPEGDPFDVAYRAVVDAAPGRHLIILRDLTPRRHAEQVAQEHETRYRYLFEMMSSGAAVYEAVDDGQNFVFKDFNQAGERQDGVKREHIIGKRVTEVFPGVKDFGLFEVFQRVWRNGEPQHFPEMFYQDNRITGWRENYVYRLPSGEIVAIYDDVTQRKQAEAALRESQEKLSFLFEILPVGVSILDEARNVLTANPALENILDLSEEHLQQGQHTQRRYLRADGSRMPLEELPSERAIREKQPIKNVEIGIVREDGETRWTNVSAVPLSISNWRVVVTTVDVTLRKRMEQRLRRERDLFNRITETSPIAITVVDRDGRISFANSRAERILGLTKDEITDLTYNASDWRITDLAGGPFPDEALPFRRVMKTGKPVYGVQHAIEWPDGRRVLLSINAAPLLDDAGRVDGMISAMEDITERVQQERKRQAQMEQELHALELLSASPQTTITAQSFNAQSIREQFPNIFLKLTQQYGDLIDLALEQRMYKVDHQLSDNLRTIAQHLGALNARPRDVVEMHVTTLKDRTQSVTSAKAKAYAEEGRLVILELMGYLTSHYHYLAMGNHHIGVNGYE